MDWNFENHLPPGVAEALGHYETRDLSARDTAGRFEFEGEIAPASIRDKYRGKAVHQYLKRGNQSPTVYVGA